MYTHRSATANMCCLLALMWRPSSNGESSRVIHLSQPSSPNLGDPIHDLLDIHAKLDFIILDPIKIHDPLVSMQKLDRIWANPKAVSRSKLGIWAHLRRFFDFRPDSKPSSGLTRFAHQAESMNKKIMGLFHTRGAWGAGVVSISVGFSSLFSNLISYKAIVLDCAVWYVLVANLNF